MKVAISDTLGRILVGTLMVVLFGWQVFLLLRSSIYADHLPSLYLIYLVLAVVVRIAVIVSGILVIVGRPPSIAVGTLFLGALVPITMLGVVACQGETVSWQLSVARANTQIMVILQFVGLPLTYMSSRPRALAGSVGNSASRNRRAHGAWSFFGGILLTWAAWWLAGITTNDPTNASPLGLALALVAYTAALAAFLRLRLAWIKWPALSLAGAIVLLFACSLAGVPIFGVIAGVGTLAMGIPGTILAWKGASTCVELGVAEGRVLGSDAQSN